MKGCSPVQALHAVVTMGKIRLTSNIAQVWTEYRIHTTNYICIYKEVQLESRLHRTGIWSAAAWPHRRLCYRPAVFFCHLLSRCALTPATKNSGRMISVSFTLLLVPPWCRVLLEKLTGSQIVKKFPAFYGTRRFITALTSVRHLSLSWASPIQSTYPHPTSWRSILIVCLI